jgi:hypothetical protein
MNGEHPWRDWLNVLVIFLGGLVIVMMVVRLLIKWAHKDGTGSQSGTDKHPR